MALNIKNNTFDLKVYKNPFYNYVKNNKQTCNNIIIDAIDIVLKHITGKITDRAVKVAGEKLNTLKNDIYYYQLHKTDCDIEFTNMLFKEKDTHMVTERKYNFGKKKVTIAVIDPEGTKKTPYRSNEFTKTK